MLSSTVSLAHPGSFSFFTSSSTLCLIHLHTLFFFSFVHISNIFTQNIWVNQISIDREGLDNMGSSSPRIIIWLICYIWRGFKVTWQCLKERKDGIDGGICMLWGRGGTLTTSLQRGNSSGEQSSGVVGGGGEGTMDPDALAQTFWHLHVQDRNAWTQEMDLRSPSARFF